MKEVEMQFTGAKIKEQGQEFAIVLIKSSVYNNPTAREKARTGFSLIFPGIPIIVATKIGNRMNYHGRPDIARFLAGISPSRIPWKTYTLQ
jgi:hypothetical protein